MSSVSQFDLGIVGAGPAGLAAGIAAAHMGLRTVVIGPEAGGDDGRTAALLAGSINLLDRLGITPLLEGQSEPIETIRIIDDTSALLRAPPVLFRSSEISRPTFGYNVPNAALVRALESKARQCLTRHVTSRVVGFELRSDIAKITTADGDVIAARVIGAADGRNSAARTAAEIPITSWLYDQAALVTTFAHTRPHNRISTEFHRSTGPLTIVPGPGNTSSLVWVETPAEAARLAGLDADAFASALGERLDSLFGRLSAFTPRRTFPLSLARAEIMGRSRVALIGEAAHAIPPIGAQGLNLSLRDGAMLAEVLSDAMAAGEDPGAQSTLDRYSAARGPDVHGRTMAIDLLNRSLISTLPGVHFARGLGLAALAGNAFLRAQIMREGVMPAANLPRLMQDAEPAPGGQIPVKLDANGTVWA